MKKLLRAAAFLLIAAYIFNIADRVLVRKSLHGSWNITAKTNGFFNLAEDSCDVVFFGSSHAYCSFNPLIIYDEARLGSYVAATQKQPVWASYYYIKEAIARQKPAAVVLDCFSVTLDGDYSDEATRYTYTDDFPDGRNKLALVGCSAEDFKSRFDLLFRFTKYHSRWSELTADDFGYNPKKLSDPLCGYCLLTSTDKTLTRESYRNVRGEIPLSEKNEDYLKRIITVCRKSGTRLLLAVNPSNETARERMIYNSVRTLAEKNDTEFINFNDLYDEIGLDISSDFYDRAHLNYRGAIKFSRYFAENMLADIPRKGKFDENLMQRRLARFYREAEGDTNPFSGILHKPAALDF